MPTGWTSVVDGWLRRCVLMPAPQRWPASAWYWTWLSADQLSADCGDCGVDCHHPRASSEGKEGAAFLNKAQTGCPDEMTNLVSGAL